MFESRAHSPPGPPRTPIRREDHLCARCAVPEYPAARARPVQGLLERLTLALGILVPPLPGAGKLGTTSASPSITLAFRAASRSASIPLISSIDRSICSSVIALMPPECSNFISRGTSIAHTFKYAAGDSRRTRLNTSRPCCCQSSARSSRKRLLNALRVASGDPPGLLNALRVASGDLVDVWGLW